MRRLDRRSMCVWRAAGCGLQWTLRLNRDRNNRYRWRGQNRIEDPPQPNKSIEDLHLRGPEGLPLEDAPADVPREPRDAVEIEDPLHAEPGLFHFFFELGVGVAPVVTERHVERTEDLLPMRNQDDGS